MAGLREVPGVPDIRAHMQKRMDKAKVLEQVLEMPPGPSGYIGGAMVPWRYTAYGSVSSLTQRLGELRLCRLYRTW